MKISLRYRLRRLLAHKRGWYWLAILIAAAVYFWPTDTPPVIDNSKREVLKTMKPKAVDYKEVVAPKKFANLNMIGEVKKTGVSGKTTDERLYGMVLRTLRFQNISRKVEVRYNLPENLILAMIMQETGGADLLPNSSDDGGIGLCHMQPLLADMFGLKTYKGCTELVCKEHGKELRAIIENYTNDRKKLLSFDDRLNPILNIDAAGRMLAYYKLGPHTRKDPVQRAILGYAGRKNYKKYYKNVMAFREKLNDKQFIDEVRTAFNQQNPKLTIDGNQADFDDYIEAHQELNLNYGLDDYPTKVILKAASSTANAKKH